jgi:hypothetical protein
MNDKKIDNDKSKDYQSVTLKNNDKNDENIEKSPNKFVLASCLHFLF